MRWGVFVGGRNFLLEWDTSPGRVGFYTTFAVDGRDEEVTPQIIERLLRHRISKTPNLSPSRHSYFWIEKVWRVDDECEFDPEGFTFYDMSSTQFIIAIVQYHLFRFMSALLVIERVYAPVKLSVNA